MLEVVELTRLIVNKTVVQERRGRGRKGYASGWLMLLVYAQLKGKLRFWLIMSVFTRKVI